MTGFLFSISGLRFSVSASRRRHRRGKAQEETGFGRLSWSSAFRRERIALRRRRCHESYIIHLGRIRGLRRRGKNNYELRLDPPVNKLIPLSRHRVAEFRKLMGVP